MSLPPLRSMLLQGAVILPICVALLGPPSVEAMDLIAISPASIDLELVPGEAVTVFVSVVVTPYCIRPFLFDVEASDPSALFQNLTGPQLNGCGGAESIFEIELVEDEATQDYDLLVVDRFFPDSPSVIGSIPVTVSHLVPEPGFAGLLGVGSAWLWMLWRRSRSALPQEERASPS